MPAHALSEAEILLRICPGASRWPKAETAAWVRLRAAVASMHVAATAVDAGCSAIDADKALSLSGARQKKAALGKAALADIEGKAYQSALRFTDGDIANFENKIASLLPPPATEFADVALAQELRTLVRSSKSPIDAAVRGLSDPRIVAAILHAPPMACGLSDAEHDLVRQRARMAAAPQQASAVDALVKARTDIVEASAAMRRLIEERCSLDEHELPPLRAPAPVAAAS